MQAPLSARFLGFSAVGLVGTAAHYGVLVGLVEWGGADPVLASVLGAAVGALVNYALSHRLVFRSRRLHREALPRFLLIAGIAFLANGLSMAGAVHGLGIPYLLAQILTSAVLLVWNYVANARWTFAGPARGEEP